MKTLHTYLKSRNLPVKRAASEIGISRQWLHSALKGEPLGKTAAKKIERWSGGEIKAADLMQI